MQTWALLFNPKPNDMELEGVSLGGSRFLVPLETQLLELPRELWVLLFKAGSESEGIYTLAIGGDNFLVCFASEDDATRYALLLEAQDFLSPTIDKIDRRELQDFCREAGYDLCVVPEGQLAIPPEHNLDETDWSPDTGSDRDAASTDEKVDGDNIDVEAMRRRLEGLL